MDTDELNLADLVLEILADHEREVRDDALEVLR